MNTPIKGDYKTPDACSIGKCERPALSRGMCNAHYLRYSKGKPLNPPIKERSKTGKCEKRGCNEPHEAKGLCRNHYRTWLRLDLWREVVDRLGGKCKHCGHSYPIAVYDLHHRDPSKKEFSVGQQIGNYSKRRILDEAAKCDLICANCHRILHFGMAV